MVALFLGFALLLRKNKYSWRFVLRSDLPQRWIQADVTVGSVHADTVQREPEQGDSPACHSRDGESQAQSREL